MMSLEKALELLGFLQECKEGQDGGIHKCK